MRARRGALLLVVACSFASATAHAASLTNLGAIADGTGGVDGLAGVHQVVVSPDGRHVYFAGETDNAIAAFWRDRITGALTFIEREQDGVGGTDGIESPQRPAFDPSGTHLYVPGNAEQALAVFARSATGALTFVEVQRNGFAGVTGLFSPNAAVVSHDGRFVYVAASFGGIVQFSRDATGHLDFEEVFTEPSAASHFLSIAVSNDGRHLYAGTDQEELFVFARDLATGGLDLAQEVLNGVGGVTGLADVQDVVVSRDGRNVYAANSSQSLVSFTRDPATGALDWIDTEFGGDHVAISADGHRVYGSYLNIGGAILYDFLVHERDPVDGSLTVIGSGGFFGTLGTDGAHGGHAITPDGVHLYGTWTGEDSAALMAVGPLRFIEQQGDGVAGVDGLDGARSVAASPDGRHLYVAGLADDAVAVFARDPVSNELVFVEREKNGEAGLDGLDGAAAVATSPDGKHVYAVAAIDDSVMTFARNATTGALGFVEREQNGVGGVTNLNGPSAVTLSPDGTSLYAVCPFSHSVVAFSRNATTGALAFVESEVDGAAGVDGLSGANAVAVSPDGEHVYVAGSVDDAIAIFDRTPATGALAYVGQVKDGGAAARLDGASAIVLSSDGLWLYAAAVADDAITIFSRDRATGLLTETGWQERTTLPQGVALDGPLGLALSRNGRLLFVASNESNSVDVFNRGRANGALGYAQIEYGASSLLGAFAVVAPASGRGVFVVASEDDALNAFVPEPAAGALGLVAVACCAAIRRTRRLGA